MNKEQLITLPTVKGLPEGDYWPSDEYERQVQILQSNLDNDIYFVEVQNGRQKAVGRLKKE